MSNLLMEIVSKQKNGTPVGMVSICTANKYAIIASMKAASNHGLPVLIEATANQVDQNGGYTGMTPSDFVSFVYGLAQECGFQKEKVILGGDHLGPLSRKNEVEADAMAYAEKLVRDYVLAGFEKIHLDTSMCLGSDPEDIALSNMTIAERSARLCAVAENAFAERKLLDSSSKVPVYVIGSEVPIPGGTQSPGESSSVTSPDQCKETFKVFRDVFGHYGLSEAFGRVLALVVQTGAEFGDSEVFQYNTDFSLTEYGRKNLPFLFEGHSTDYQLPENLKTMVQDGIAFLKVGPALTFALREALYALEKMEEEFFPGALQEKSGFSQVLDDAMTGSPEYWQDHYHGNEEQIRLARKYSYSDRSRYYLNYPEVETAIDLLIRNINSLELPPGMVSQYLPRENEALRQSGLQVSAEDLIYQHIGFYLEGYYQAVEE